MFDKISGTVEKIIFFNPISNYAVLKIKEESSGKRVVVVGNFPELSPGEWLSASGKWVKSEKWGEQFKAENYELQQPSTVSGMRKFLASGLIKGIGPELAKRIVEKFGEETLEIISKKPEKLLEVNGLGEKKAESIVESWKEHEEKSYTLIKLQELGLTIKMAMKIYKEYGMDAVRVINENPYKLADDVYGIGFKIADRIALSSGIEKKSPLRIKAFILFILGKELEDGNLFSYSDSLIEKIKKELELESQETILLKSLMDELEKEGKIVRVKLDEEEILYSPFYFKAEKEIAKRLIEILKFPKPKIVLDVAPFIQESELEMGIKFTEKQRIAIESSLNEKIIILTGGPGTGKTTIIRAILNIHKKLGKMVLLCAPTGRAAKKLSEATEEEAKTIHRLLEYKPGENVFMKNESNPLKGDILIVDEFSMVDIPLMYHLMRAIPPWTSLLFVGDKDQLPSVGPGNIIKDLIQSGIIKVIELDEIFRQSRESMIIVNSHRIRKGLFPYLYSKKRDFIFISEEDEVKVFDTVIYLVSEEIPEKFLLDPLTSQIQVIAPMYKGINGIDNYNKILQEKLNPNGEYFTGIPFKSKDKVMQIKNNYEKEVYNGDIGRVVSVDEKGVLVLFEKVVKYERDELDELTLAYAISVHKSQGSEYEACVMPILTQHYIMLQRNLLYTALTRAKKLAVLVGSNKALAIAIKNNRPNLRNTRLSNLLTELKEVNP
ncbi:MAG: SF1B family DNA helicase RecD2 [Candidatus Aminicenantia bacterium]